MKAKNRKRRGGRPKLYSTRILLPLAEGTLADLEAIRGAGETRLDVIRAAIEREIERRVNTARSRS
jgi:hypothetical protein